MKGAKGRTLVIALAAMALVAVGLMSVPVPTQTGGSAPSVTRQTSAATLARVTTQVREVKLSSLPKEASDVMRAINAGPPFPGRKDGVVFYNREGKLPQQASGYYHEFTVLTPGEDDRGARRIVTGGPRYGLDNSEFYYTGDHYNSFERIRT